MAAVIGSQTFLRQSVRSYVDSTRGAEAPTLCRSSLFRALLSTAPVDAEARVGKKQMLGGSYLDSGHVMALLTDAGAPERVRQDLGRLTRYTLCPMPVPEAPQAEQGFHEAEQLYQADWHRISTPSREDLGSGSGDEAAGSKAMPVAPLDVDRLSTRVAAVENSLVHIDLLYS